MGKIQEEAAALFLVVLRGFQRGKGSRANPAKRFAWEKEEQRNGRDLPLAAGRGMWSLFRRKSPFAVFFLPPAAFSLPRKEKGAETYPAPSARRADRVVRPYKPLPRTPCADKVSPFGRRIVPRPPGAAALRAFGAEFYIFPLIAEISISPATTRSSAAKPVSKFAEYRICAVGANSSSPSQTMSCMA